MLSRATLLSRQGMLELTRISLRQISKDPNLDLRAGHIADGRLIVAPVFVLMTFLSDTACTSLTVASPYLENGKQGSSHVKQGTIVYLPTLHYESILFRMDTRKAGSKKSLRVYSLCT